MASRLRFWLNALENGASSLNGAAGWFGLVVLLLGIVAGVVVPVVVHVSHWLTAVIILGLLVVMVLEGSYRVWAATDGDRKDAMESARAQPSPVTADHREDLRRVARRLRDSLRAGKSADYGQEDPAMWRRAFIAHFPALEPSLDKAAQTGAAFESLKHHLKHQLADGLMSALPQWSGRVAEWLATRIEARAKSSTLGSDFDVPWVRVIGKFQPAGSPGSAPIHYVNLSVETSPGTSLPVFEDCDKADVPERKSEFEAFFKNAESSPEAAAIRRAWDELDAIRADAIQQLAAAANTEPIRSTCFLCGGAAQPVAR